MKDSQALAAAVRAAWAQIPAPSPDSLGYLAWACGEDAWHAFVNVAPVDVDISSSSFLGCTPLLELPPATAAAYLGTYLLSLLDGLEFQENFTVFYDILTRAHVIHCLNQPQFWTTIRPHLPAECRHVLVEICAYLVTRRELLGLPEEQTDQMVALSQA